MILCKTPFRISFFGGGTDIFNYFSKFGGLVISSTIDKYCYVTFKKNLLETDNKISIFYNLKEELNDPKKIRHPLIRQIFIEKKIKSAEMHYDADLPGMSGLGTSSSFGVGLIHAIDHSKNKKISPKNLSNEVIDIERYKLQESGGYQDQIACAYGGLNKIMFNTKYKYNFKVKKIELKKHIMNQINNSIILVHLDLKRQSSKHSLANFKLNKHIIKNLNEIKNHAQIAENYLINGQLESFGDLLNETWMQKREIKEISNSFIDRVYKRVYNTNLVLGGKLLGAGGGGFILFWVKENKQKELRRKLINLNLKYVDINLTNEGSKIIEI
tara:strand:- start:477 stop:1460 length:984 start_codon:yes stop_codon:yes gene_type:complete